MDDSDGSDMVIEVLCNHVCRRLPFVYDHTMWTVVVRSTLSVSRRQDRRDVGDCISRVPTQIWSTFILNMFIILRLLCREFDSL